jgi:UDP-glucose 4-epimerase
MRAVITGSSGFVGGVIARGLHRQGFEVHGWDQRPPQWSSPTFENRIHTSIVDLVTENIASLIDRCAPNVVVHAAGPASVTESFNDPVRDNNATAIPWHRLLDGIRQTKCRPIIVLISSAAVYGEPATQPVAESCLLKPVSPYGFHRRISELLAEEYAQIFGVDVAICRLFSTFGPSQHRLLVWELFEQALSDCSTIVLQGTGEESRDYLYEDDLANIIALLANHHPKGLTTWNLATGRDVTTRKLAELVAIAAGKPKPIECRGVVRRGEPLQWRADVAQLQRLLNNVQLTSLEDGLKYCADFWKTAPGGH